MYAEPRVHVQSCVQICKAVCLRAELCANLQSCLFICSAACKFAKPRVHVHQPHFINTLCFQPSTSLKSHTDLVVGGEFIKSRGDRRLVKAATVLPPPVQDKAYRLFSFVDTGFW